MEIKILLSTKLGEKKWMRKKLADLTGIRPTTIGAWYNEMTDFIKLEHLALICEALECDVGDILKLEAGRDSGLKKK